MCAFVRSVDACHLIWNRNISNFSVKLRFVSSPVYGLAARLPACFERHQRLVCSTPKIMDLMVDDFRNKLITSARAQVYIHIYLHQLWSAVFWDIAACCHSMYMWLSHMRRPHLKNLYEDGRRNAIALTKRKWKTYLRSMHPLFAAQILTI